MFAALFFPLFLLFTATASYEATQVNDAIAAAVPAWQVANEGSLTIPPEAPRNVWFVEAQGRRVSNRFPGVIAFAVPFYGLTRGSAPEATVPEASIAAAFSAALATALTALLLRRVVSSRVAVAGALLFGLGTTTWTVAGASLLTHGPAQLWLVAGMLASSSGSWALTVPCHALAVLTRPHLAVAPLCAALWHAGRERAWRAAAWLVLGVCAGLALLLAYNHHVYGGWSLEGGYGTTVGRALGRNPVTLAFNLMGSLVSPARGLLGFSPFVLLLLAGLRPAWRAAPSWARASALGGLAYLLVQMQANRFSGGTGFYGYRLQLETLALATPLLALSYREWVAARPWRRRVFAVLAAYSVGVQALGAVWSGSKGPPDPSPWTYLTQVRAAQAAGALGVLAASAFGIAVVALLARSVAGTYADETEPHDLRPQAQA